MPSAIAKKQPYVGVAATRSVQQVLALWTMTGLLHGQALACGIQVSNKTLANLPNKHPAVFPPMAELAEIVETVADLADLEVHLHFFPGDSGDGLRQKLQSLAQVAGPYVDGLQINSTFPDVEAVRWWRDHYPNGRLILPITPGSLSESHDDPGELLSRFSAYDGLITDLFFDLSGGLGKPVDVDLFLDCTDPFRQSWPQLRLAVAGGLGPTTLAPIKELIRLGVWPLSWDAQSRLYIDDGEGLDINKAEQFLTASGQLTSLVRQ